MTCIAVAFLLTGKVRGLFHQNKGTDVLGNLRQEACASFASQFSLSDREAEVLTLLSEGHSQKKIAEILFISTSTVQTHVKSIYRKSDHHTKQEVIDEVVRRVDSLAQEA